MAEGIGKVRLVGCVGAICTATLLTCVPMFEGTVDHSYRDPVGIVTSCTGHTGPELKVGQKFTKEQCQEQLIADLLKHAEPVLKCTPGLKDQPYRLAASVSFAFNEGVTAYCDGPIGRHFRAGDYEGGCRNFNESDTGRPQYITADGKVLAGLVRRRAYERAMCEGK